MGSWRSIGGPRRQGHHVLGQVPLSRCCTWERHRVDGWWKRDVPIHWKHRAGAHPNDEGWRLSLAVDPTYVTQRVPSCKKLRIPAPKQQELNTRSTSRPASNRIVRPATQTNASTNNVFELRGWDGFSCCGFEYDVNAKWNWASINAGVTCYVIAQIHRSHTGRESGDRARIKNA